MFGERFFPRKKLQQGPTSLRRVVGQKGKVRPQEGCARAGHGGVRTSHGVNTSIATVHPTADLRCSVKRRPLHPSLIPRRPVSAGQQPPRGRKYRGPRRVKRPLTTHLPPGAAPRLRLLRALSVSQPGGFLSHQ